DLADERDHLRVLVLDVRSWRSRGPGARGARVLPGVLVPADAVGERDGEARVAADVLRLPLHVVHERDRIQSHRRHAARTVGEAHDDAAVGRRAPPRDPRDRACRERAQVARNSDPATSTSRPTHSSVTIAAPSVSSVLAATQRRPEAVVATTMARWGRPSRECTTV